MIFAAAIISATIAAANWQPPNELNGWKLHGRPMRVTPDNIFDYMNGAGELYLAYAFKTLDVWTFKHPAEGGILLEIYDMTRPEEAFGVLSQDLDGPDGDVGDRSVYAAGLLRFCKGRYFGRVLADVETEKSKRTVLELARRFAESVDEKGTVPRLVERLPNDRLRPATVHYFHKKLVLDYIYYLADENILLLDAGTNAVLADYSSDGGCAKLLVVEYPEKAAARKAWEQFHRVYLEKAPPAADSLSSCRLEDGKWVSVWLAKKYLLITFEASRRETGEKLLGAAHSKIRTDRKEPTE